MTRALATAVLLAGCAAAVPHVTAEQVAWAAERWPAARVQQLEHGRSLYVTRCSSCHAAPAPAEVAALGTEEMVKEMAERARLSDEEQQLVLQFVEAVTSSPAKVASRERR